MTRAKGVDAPQFSVEAMAEALVTYMGINTQVAQAMNCSVDTVERYIKKYATCRDAKKRGQRSLVDLAQSKMVIGINNGSERLIMYVLSTLGKEEGYGTNVAVSGQVDLSHTGTVTTQPDEATRASSRVTQDMIQTLHSLMVKTSTSDQPFGAPTDPTAFLDPSTQVDPETLPTADPDPPIP